MNPSTLAVEFELALGNYPGRGGLSVPITLNYSSKIWRVAYQSYTPSVQNTFDGQMLDGFTTLGAVYQTGWTSSIGVPVILADEFASRYNLGGMALPETNNCDQMVCKRIDRVMIRMPDNSVHELRSSDEPYTIGNGFSLPSPIPDDLYAVDGSGLRYQRSTQALFLPDGSRYILNNTSPVYIDRNGNTHTFTADFPFNFQNNIDVGMSDTLNRSIPAFKNPHNDIVNFSLPGMNGVLLTYSMNWKRLGDAGVMSPGQTLHYITNLVAPGGPGLEPSATDGPSLFNSDSAGRTFFDDPSPFNPFVLHQIVLPNGQTYTLNYNVYGELEKITFPGGGYERYEYEGLMPLSLSGTLYSQANRGVSKRFVSKSGNSADEVRWTYAYTGTFSYNTGQGAYVISITAPDGSRVERYLHTDSLSGAFGFNADQGKAGMAYDERQYSAPDTLGTRTLLRRNLTEWVTTNSNASNQQAQSNAKRNGRVTKEVEIVLDTGTTNALARTTVHNYDLTYQFSSGPIESSVVEYDWVTIGQTNGQSDPIESIPISTQPVRITETTNLLLDTTIPQATRDLYRARHLVNLPSSIRTKNGSGTVVAQSSMKYDEYSLTTVGAVNGWLDPQTTVRGNLTTVGRWLNTTGTEIQTHTHYDQFGNPRIQTDARGKETLIGYSSNHVYPTTITTPIPDPSGIYGANTAFTSTTEYDDITGLVLSTTDANGKTTSISYEDPLRRLTQVTQPNGAHVNYTYSDAVGDLYVKVRTDQDSSRAIETRTYFDGLSRPVRSFRYDGTASTPWVATDTYYDVMGRPFKVSNPYRIASPSGIVPSSCSPCTTSTYDSLGRLISVTSPDNADVTTSYGAHTSGTLGITTLVTDQAGKKRKSLTDALGRLIAVYEDPTNLKYLTSYSYDVLGNLTNVTQDSQMRTFTYDSLSRLHSAINPESGTAIYEYDNNGNLIKKMDARGVESVYAYDALNRNITIDYSDTVTINPDVTRIYDGAANGKGRQWKTYKGGDESTGSNVEKTEVVSYDAAGRPLTQRQFFKQNSAWNAVQYQITRTYNLAGNVTSQNYPSGHSVSYSYDDAGRINSFNGTLGDNNNRAYATAITYGSGGQMIKEQFGTNTAVYNKLLYNSRQQLAEIIVNTTGADNVWDRGRIVNDYSLQCSGAGCNANDNNGNLRKQTVYIPANDQVSAPTSWYQQYDYDELNRLKRVHEYTGVTASDWQQEYLYDRWGNRRIDTNVAKTFGTGINNKGFEKQDTTNQLYAPGDLALSDTQRRIRYDAAGNQIKDTYTGYGTASFDAENHITAIQDKNGGTATYTYNADGQRTRRKIGNLETWQIYGMDAELLAEYSASGATNAPQKEYGYRNGQLLVTAVPPQTIRQNFALRSNGGSASASSEISAGCSTWPARGAIDGDRKGSFWGNNGGWADSSSGSFSNDWFQVDFDSQKTIDELDIFTLQDNPNNPSEPTETMTFSTYGLTAYSVSYWNGSAWINIPEASVVGNNKVWRKFAFSPITTNKIRVYPQAAVDNGYSRLTEVEAWGTVTMPTKTNIALRSNGAVASASSEISGGCDTWPARGANDGDRKGAYWGNTGGWADSNSGNFSNDWLQVDFNGNKTINEIDVFTLQDNYASPVEPNEATTFSTYGLTAFDVSYWNGSNWVQIPETAVTGNNKVWRKFTFNPISTSKIRVYGRAAIDNGFSRIAEVQAWSPTESGAGTGVEWLVTDQLGTPRMVIDQTGNLAAMKRHDYLPFGEELYASQGLRKEALGYSNGDGVRQQFTSKERDVETGLDYFLARYYQSTQGRFSSPDEFKGGPEELFENVDPHDPLFYADTAEPQSLNKYQYALNNPLRYVDVDGHQATVADRLKAGAASVGRSLMNTLEGAASAYAEDQGIGGTTGPQNSVGRGIGHTISIAQSVVEIAGGAYLAAGGGAEAVATSPAAVTVVGSALPAVGVATAVVGVGAIVHGAATGANAVNNIFRGNAKSSTNPQHGYEIVDKKGDVKKVGVSGQPLNQNGTSPRANLQVNKANIGRPFKDWLEGLIRKRNVPSRKEILEWEKKQAEMRRMQGNSMEMHKRP